MEAKKIKWLIYTVLVGLIPVLSRMVAWVITTRGTVDFVTPPDFISFGLVLHISNINEIENLANVNQSWRTKQNGMAIVFIAVYSMLFTLSLVPEKIIDKSALLYSSVLLAVASSFLSYSVYNYLVRAEAAQ